MKNETAFLVFIAIAAMVVYAAYGPMDECTDENSFWYCLRVMGH